MVWMILFLIYATAAVIIYQDFKFRAVIWIAFPVLALLGIVYSLVFEPSFTRLLMNSSVNIVFLVLQFGLLYIYFRMKRATGKLVNDKIGLGDILFLLATCFFFSPLFFLLFYISSLAFSLLAFLLFRKKLFPAGSLQKIPLAGFQAIFFIAFLTVYKINNLHITQDDLLLNSLLPYDY